MKLPDIKGLNKNAIIMDVVEQLEDIVGYVNYMAFTKYSDIEAFPDEYYEGCRDSFREVHERLHESRKILFLLGEIEIDPGENEETESEGSEL